MMGADNSQTHLFNALGEGLLCVDANLRIESLNPALFDLIGGGASDELVGSGLAELGASELVPHVIESRDHGVVWRGEVEITRKDGSTFPAWAVVSPLQNAAAKKGPVRSIVLISDMTDRKAQEQEIRRRASLDQLTGLPNRELLQDRLKQSLAQAKRNGSRVAVLFVDLDYFKEVNDTWGHAIGDALLVEAADRMCKCVRETDTVARIGGDEFVITLSDVGDNQIAEKVASKILGGLERPFILDGVAVYVSGSIGLAISPEHGSDPETLYANADAAMYQVKRDGRRGYRVYEASPEKTENESQIVFVKPEKAVRAPRTPPLLVGLRQLLTKKMALPPVPLLPAGLAAVGVAVLFGWMVATGMATFQLGNPNDNMTEAELGNFGTAAGREEGNVVPNPLKDKPRE